MSFAIERRGALEYLISDCITAKHAFSTRRGGVSEGVLSSLNLGPYRGDRPGNVLENYRILGRAVGFSVQSVVFTRQEHTDIVLPVGPDDCGYGLIWPQEQICDGLITNARGVTLTVFTADCTPILLHDPVRGAVGAVHAGWRGTAKGIAARAVEQMCRHYGCRPSDIHAAIGPCISACCFETDRDVPDAMHAALGAEADAAITCNGEKYHVDLKKLNALWLRRAGVTQVDICQQCTACDAGRFWSHRRMGAARGSLAAVITL